MSNPVVIFTDASRVETVDVLSAAYGWIALDSSNLSDSIPMIRVQEVQENKENTVAAEVLAIWDAVQSFPESTELHIYTDSKYAVQQVEKIRNPEFIRKRPINVLPEILQLIAARENVRVVHVQAHNGHFYNELVDQMCKKVSFGEMLPADAVEWAKTSYNAGYITLQISKKNTKPIYFNQNNAKTTEFIKAMNY